MRSTIALTLIASTVAATSAIAWTPVRRQPQVVDVAGSEAFAHVTQVVVMRHGARTVLSVQRAYDGSPEMFAMVIPVPAVLHATDVQALPREVFELVDHAGAPVLVESWPQDDCLDHPAAERPPPLRAVAVGVPASDVARPRAGVTIEAQFTAGEYQLAVVSATDAARLAAWLRAERYQLPGLAAASFEPYVRRGMKFLVAKVDPTKASFAGGRMVLSPLRLAYDSDEFTLPIGIGMGAPNGPHDLIVSILALAHQYQVAGQARVVMPHGQGYPAARDEFDAFYAGEFERLHAQQPDAVVTEKAWVVIENAWHRDVGPEGLAMLGLDALDGVDGTSLELTRLHARYDGPIPAQLEFEPVSAANTVWTRYVITHPGLRPGACAQRWGAPPESAAPAGSQRSGCASGRLAALAGAGVMALALVLVLVLRRRRRSGFPTMVD